MLEYSPTSAFWLFNRTTNFAYMRYDMISADIRKVTDKWENDMLRNVQALNARVGKMSPEARRSHLTQLSVETAQQLFDRWQRLNNYLLVKYMDGNVKSEHGRRADVPRRRRLCGAFRRQRQRETDSRQDPVPGLQREMEARRGQRQW